MGPPCRARTNQGQRQPHSRCPPVASVKCVRRVPQEWSRQAAKPPTIELCQPYECNHQQIMQRLSLVSQSIYSISKNKYDNLGKILYLNGLLLVNISFGMAATQIVPEIADQMNYPALGQVVVLIQYVMGMIGNLFAPLYLKRFTYRWAFFLTASAGLWQCLAGLYIVIAYKNSFTIGATYAGCVLLACLNGWCYGGLWVAQNLYISENANDNNRALFFGISNSLSNSAGIIGSVTSIYLIRPLGEFWYFVALFFLSLGTQLLYFFVLQPPGKKPSEGKQQSKDQNGMEMSVQKQRLSVNYNGAKANDDIKDTFTLKTQKALKASDERSRAYSVNGHSESQESELAQLEVQKRKQTLINQHKQDYEVIEFFNDLPIQDQLKMIWEVAKSEKIRPIIPYMIATGIVLGFEYGVYYKLIQETIFHTYPYSTNTDVQVKTFIIFGCQGLMEIFGGLAIGGIGDKLNINFTSIIQSSWIHIVLFVTFADCFILNYGMAIAFGLMWGFADCAGQANCMSLLSEEWGDDIRVFGLYNFSQNFGAITAIAFSIIMGYTPFYIYLLLIFFWMMFSNLNMNFYRRTRRVKEYELYQ